MMSRAVDEGPEYDLPRPIRKIDDCLVEPLPGQPGFVGFFYFYFKAEQELKIPCSLYNSHFRHIDR